MSAESGRPTGAAADPFAAFKQVQREGWSHFGPLAVFTTPSAARLVRFAGIRTGSRVLDVGSGTGVVAITAARAGAKVTGSDLTPELLEQARENARIAGATLDWREADVESLPFEDGAFDVVTSQFGHMFAPRPDVAIGEMLRVLKPGGTIAFSTWPPDRFTGSFFKLVASYGPPLPPEVAPPIQWGEPETVRARLGAAVKDVTFEREVMRMPALSTHHAQLFMERNLGPATKALASLEAEPERAEALRAELRALIGAYFEDNTVRQDFLMTRATKA